MRISVVIPTYNRKRLLLRAVESVLAQTFPAYEIIVVDDGSTDATREALRPYGKRIRYIYQEKSGVSAARNSGITTARGDWIALLDSDDLWHPQKLERQAAFHCMHPEYRWSHTLERWIRDGYEVRQKVIHAKPTGACFADNLPFCKIAPSTVMIEKRLFEVYGAFDPALPVCEDYDLWLRFLRHAPIGLVEEVLTTKFGGHTQLSTSGYLLDRYRIAALVKHLPEAGVQETIARKLKILHKGALKHHNVEMIRFCLQVKRQLQTSSTESTTRGS